MPTPMNSKTVSGFRGRMLRRFLLGCAVAAAPLTWNEAASAQSRSPDGDAASASQGDAATGQDIVVTANKRSESLLKVPMSITAVSGDQLAAKGISDVQDLVKITPGLSYVESGRSIPVFSLRGVGYFDQSVAARPTVSVYNDEAPLPFSIEAKGASFDLERVEVLKGPQGTLFGQNATGGAINYIAAKPTNDLHAGLIASYGRFDTADIQGFVSGPLTSTLNARLALRTVQSGDWQRSYTRDDTLGAQRFTQGRFLLDWRPDSRLKVQVNVNGFHDGSDTQAPQYIAFAPSSAARAPLVPLMASYPTASADPRAADWDTGYDYRNDTDFLQANLRVDYEATDHLTITSLSSYSQEDLKQLAEGDGTALANLNIGVTAKLKTYYQELRAAGDIGALSFIAGLTYERDLTKQAVEVYVPYSTVALSLGGGANLLDRVSTELNQNFDTQAIFGNLDYALNNRITLHAGIRYTAADLNFDGCSKGLSPTAAAYFTTLANRTLTAVGLPNIAPVAVGQCATLSPSGTTDRYYSKLNQENVSWRAGIDFKPTPNTLIYLTVSKGYKAGSASIPAATNNLQFTPASQESVLAYEGGIKTRLMNGKVEFTAAAFHYDYRDKQVLGRVIFQPNVFGPQNALVNIPKSKIDGIEAQISVFPVRGLTLTAAGTYLHSEIISDFPTSDLVGLAANAQGEAFPYTPDWQLVFDGEYRFPVGGGVNGVIGSNASYRSGTTSYLGGNSLGDIDGYWLVDARAGVEFGDGRYRVTAYGRNLTNQYYWTNISRQVDNARRYVGMPLTYGVQFAVKF